MVLAKADLVASLQNEVRILLHLAGKIDRARLDYRPTPKQRSTLELIRYLSMMGPTLVEAIKAGTFDRANWTAAETKANERDFDQALAEIARQSETYAALIEGISDAELRGEVEMFGRKGMRGPLLVNIVLCGCAAYRTQLFLYLKACGREELSTMNLWAGVDALAAV
jgi:hypothetical protein